MSLLSLQTRGNLTGTHRDIADDSDDFVVRYYPDQADPYAVQIFLGSSYATLYITPDQARILRDNLIGALPEEA